MKRPPIQVLLWLSMFVCTTGVEAADEVEIIDALSCMTHAIQTVTLGAPVAGRVSAVLVQEGDPVTAGKGLVQLENKLQELAADKQSLIFKNKEALTAAHLNEARQKEMLLSAEKLFAATQSINQEEVEKRRLDHALAVVEIRRLEQQKSVDAVDLKIAEEDVRRRLITAPFAGFILQLHKQKGENADTNTPMVELADTSQGEIVCNLNEKAVRGLQLGQMVKAKIKAGDDFLELPAKIRFISPVMDSASGLTIVKLIFDNAHAQIRLGVPGTLLLPTTSAK